MVRMRRVGRMNDKQKAMIEALWLRYIPMKKVDDKK